MVAILAYRPFAPTIRNVVICRRLELARMTTARPARHYKPVAILASRIFAQLIPNVVMKPSVRSRALTIIAPRVRNSTSIVTRALRPYVQPNQAVARAEAMRGIQRA